MSEAQLEQIARLEADVRAMPEFQIGMYLIGLRDSEGFPRALVGYEMAIGGMVAPLIASAKEEGAREMRERAAKSCEGRQIAGMVLADHIRALSPPNPPKEG